MVGTNGIYQNGLSTNGIYQNGIFQNGIYQNGIYQNGIFQNGIYQNGIFQNGIYQNGIYQNGIYQNGLWTSGAFANSTWQTGLAADALRSNPYARILLQYIYACAMPPSLDATGHLQYLTALDPNGGALTCGAGGQCDDGYACNADNRCVIELTPSIGVGINADGTSWAQSGRCDESCQRWVSACVLARTNAFGVHVSISMRAPDDAPPAIKNALAVSADEAATYTLREGAFYGNLFALVPETPYAGVDGPAAGPFISAPALFACAGPGSNLPAVTRRFCSSQGDNGPINPVGTCMASCAVTGTGSSPAFGDCFTSTDATLPRSQYREVINVYLMNPIAVCGDAVCETGGATPETPLSCPSDCHPGTWAKSFDVSLLSGFATANQTHKLAVGPDNEVVVADLAFRAAPFSLGGALLTGTYPSPGPDLVVAKYDRDGNYLWGQRFRPAILGAGNGWVEAVAIGADGSIAVAGTRISTPDVLWVAKFAADGTLAPGWPIALGGAAQIAAGLSLAVDGAGNVGVLGMHTGTATFGATQLTVSASQETFVAKLWADGSSHAGGPVAWAVARPQVQPMALAFDPAGDVYGAGLWYPNGVYKLAGSDGHLMWTKDLDTASQNYTWPVALATDPGGNVYVAGNTINGKDFGGGMWWSNSASTAFVVKYSPDGAYRWDAHIKAACPDGTPTCQFNYNNGQSSARFVTVASGNVIVGGTFKFTVDFGSGLFNSYRTPDAFIAAYSTADTLDPGQQRLLWAKDLPMVLDSTLAGFAVDGRGHVVVGGNFSGSTVVDDRLLVNSAPELTSHPNVFVGSFASPPPLDRTPPQIVYVPSSAVLEATLSPSGRPGAPVWYSAPGAIDDAAAGTNVSCLPASSSWFPLGSTVVHCTATDLVGNASFASFTITVLDRQAPRWVGSPADVTLQATTRSGAQVPFSLEAVDQADPSPQVTCTPASGSLFPVGTTTVSCVAKDASNNTSSTASFRVVVTPPPDVTPPVITVPTTVTVAGGPSGAVATWAASATDDVDGPVAVACSPASGSVFAYGTTTVTCTAHDATGNTASASFLVVVEDRTPPVLTVPAPIAAEATGPSGAVVVYAASALDNVDGPVRVTCTPASGSTFPLGATTVLCSARDAAGNVASQAFTVAVLDRTAPAMVVPSALTAEAAGPSGAVVTFAASASDLVSGAVPATCLPASGSTFPLGLTTVTCSATDAAGNLGSASFTVSVVDTTPPAITVPAEVAASAASGAGAVATWTASALDAVDGAVAVTCTPASGALFAVGSTMVTCTAVDAHGNSASRSFVVRVTYAWSGVLQPINPNGTSIFRLGSTVAVKFQLTGASSTITTANATLSLRKLSNGILGTDLEATSTAAASSGNAFRYDAATGQYVFNLATGGLSAGTWSLDIDLHDGTIRSVLISLR